MHLPSSSGELIPGENSFRFKDLLSTLADCDVWLFGKFDFSCWK